MKTSRRIFDSETVKAIGAKLRELRGDRTLAEFAARLGVERTTWSNYEAGRRLPSHEVFELIASIEHVPMDTILPTAPLARITMGEDTSDYWGYIPVLWLFSRLVGNERFESESDRLKWWAGRVPALSLEFQSRVFDLASKRDLYLEDAAIQVCDDLAKRSIEELQAFVEAAK